MRNIPLSNQGRAVDDFFESEKKPVEYHILASLQAHFDYLECQGCGKIGDVFRFTPEEIKDWKFDLMGLRQGLLRVARGTCPVCQAMFKDFAKVLRE
jgi:hypothetical protein